MSGDLSTAAAIAAEQWRALAPLLAGRPRVRVSRDGGRNYHQRWERNLTGEVPHQPAAVPLYTAGGECRTLVVDLDSSKGGPEAVRRDAAAIEQLVHRAGGRLIRDHSPNGGVHLYLPLSTPVPFQAARDLAVALAARTPTMDPSPNHNLVAGLIRPPGSRHRSGGFQVLDGSLAAAHHLARTGNPAPLFQTLQSALSAELDKLRGRPEADPAPPFPSEPDDTAPDQGRELTPRYAQIARTGLYDAGRYRTPSEARQAVITSAAAAGITLPQVLRRMDTGIWPGLASFYARYRPGARAAAIGRDYRAATAWIARHREPAETPPDVAVHKSHTSGPAPHGGGSRPAGSAPAGDPAGYQWLRHWENAVRGAELQRYPGRAGYGPRFLLRALGEAARKRGSRHVEFGVRSLAIAAGVDHGTAAGYLRRLRDEKDPFIVLVREHNGLDADLYELVIPGIDQPRAGRLAWRPGLTHALRPAFRELGHVAALVYETVEHSPTPLSTTELIDRTQISRAGVHDALETLAAFDLVRTGNGRWAHNPAANLGQLAEQLGCVDAVHEQMTRYAAERAVWQALVMSGRYLTGEVIIDDIAWLPWPEPPPDDTHTLFDLLDTVGRSA